MILSIFAYIMSVLEGLVHRSTVLRALASARALGLPGRTLIGVMHDSWSCFHWHSLKLYISAIPPRGGGRGHGGWIYRRIAKAYAYGLDSWSGFTCELYISATPPRGGVGDVVDGSLAIFPIIYSSG